MPLPPSNKDTVVAIVDENGLVAIKTSRQIPVSEAERTARLGRQTQPMSVLRVWANLMLWRRRMLSSSVAAWVRLRFPDCRQTIETITTVTRAAVWKSNATRDIALADSDGGVDDASPSVCETSVPSSKTQSVFPVLWSLDPVYEQTKEVSLVICNSN